MRKGSDIDTFNAHSFSEFPGIEEKLPFLLVEDEIFPLQS